MRSRRLLRRADDLAPRRSRTPAGTAPACGRLRDHRCWAWIGAVAPTDALFGFAESARNLVWISLLYSLSSASKERQHGLKLVYGRSPPSSDSS